VRKLQDEMGLVDSIYTWSGTPDYMDGSFVIGAVLDPKNVEKVEAAVLSELADLKRTLVSSEELRRAKQQKQAELVFAGDTVEGRAEQLGADLLETGDIAFSQHYVERIQRVTPQDIQRAVKRYLDFGTRVVCVLQPKSEPGTQAVAAPAVPPTTAERQLPNGMRVIVRSDPQAATVHISVAGEAGLRSETPQTSGITNFMAQMLLRGTVTRNREQIANVFESVGGSVGAYAGRIASA